MSDLPVVTHFDVPPNVEVHRLWTDQQIAEKETRIKRLEADMEEILRAQTAKIQAQIIMLKREVAALYDKKDQLGKHGANDVIDVKQISKQ